MSELKTKAELRRSLLRKRKGCAPFALEELERKVLTHLRKSKAYNRATSISIYFSMADEFPTQQIIYQAYLDKKRVALPKCLQARKLMWKYLPEDLSTESLDVFLAELKESCELSSFNIYEPKDALETAFFDKDTLALVPGLAFDRLGNRLGYGGGFYDVFLAEFEGLSIGICNSQSVYDDLAAEIALEPHDVAVDKVLCELGFLTN